MIEITAEKIQVLKECPRRFHYKFVAENKGQNIYWKMRNVVAKEVIQELIAETQGVVPLFLEYSGKEFIDKCWTALSFIQLRHQVNIPQNHMERFVDNFSTYWKCLKSAISPYSKACLKPTRDFVVELPSLEKFDVQEKYRIRAISDFSLVSPEITILGIVNFKKEPFKNPQKLALKLLTYVYFLTTKESPDYVGMLFGSTGKFKFLERHLYKEEYIRMFKQDIWEFIQAVDKGIFSGVICKKCNSCSYASNCPEYRVHKRHQDLCLEDSSISLDQLV